MNKRQLLEKLEMVNPLSKQDPVADLFTMDELRLVAKIRRMDRAATDKWLADRKVAAGAPAGEPGFESLESMRNRLHYQYHNHPDPENPRPGSRAKNMAQLDQVIWQNVATSLVPGGGCATLLFLLSKRASLETLVGDLTVRPIQGLHYVANIVGLADVWHNDALWASCPADKYRLAPLVIPPTYRWYFAPVHPADLIYYLARWVENYGANPTRWVLEGCPPVKVRHLEDTDLAKKGLDRLETIRSWGNTNEALREVVEARWKQIHKGK